MRGYLVIRLYVRVVFFKFFPFIYILCFETLSIAMMIIGLSISDLEFDPLSSQLQYAESQLFKEIQAIHS